jgi:hypothetical protein
MRVAAPIPGIIGGLIECVISGNPREQNATQILATGHATLLNRVAAKRTAALILACFLSLLSVASLADSLFGLETERDLARFIVENYNVLTGDKCAEACVLAVGNSDFKFAPVRLDDRISFFVSATGQQCGSAGCPVGVMSSVGDHWQKVFESFGQPMVLSTRTSNHLDLEAAGSPSIRYVWDNGRYIVAEQIAVSTAPARQSGPSFACPSPRDPLAQLICSDPKLSRLDLEFVQVYQALRQQVGEAGQQQVRREAVEFGLFVRRSCGIALAQSADSKAPPLPAAPPTAASCVLQAYSQRKSLWQARLNGPAAEEASRPFEQQVALQAALQRLKFLPETATTDGLFGPATRAAISAWQNASGRTPNGLLADADAAALEESAGVGPAVVASAPNVSPQTAPPAAATGIQPPVNGPSTDSVRPRDASLAQALTATGVLGEWSDDCSKARTGVTAHPRFEASNPVGLCTTERLQDHD